MLEFFNRFIAILSENPELRFIVCVCLVGIIATLGLLITSKNIHEDLRYARYAILAVSVAMLIMNDYSAEKVIETSPVKQIYSNKENINLSLEPNKKPSTAGDTVLELLQRENLKDLTAGHLNAYKKEDSLKLRAAKDGKSTSKTVYLKDKDIQNPSKRKDAKLTKLEIYKETLEVIYLFKTKRETRTYIKPTFEADKDVSQLEQFLEP